jgi:hypothetical protein
MDEAMIPVERKIPEPMTIPTMIITASKSPICLASFGSSIQTKNTLSERINAGGTVPSPNEVNRRVDRPPNRFEKAA